MHQKYAINIYPTLARSAVEVPLACPLASGSETPLGLVCMSPSAIAAPANDSARRSTAVEPNSRQRRQRSEDSRQTAADGSADGRHAENKRKGGRNAESIRADYRPVTNGTKLSKTSTNENGQEEQQNDR